MYSEKLELVLQHSLVLLFSDLQPIPSKVQFSSISREHLHLQKSIRFTDTMETTKIQAHLVKLLFVKRVVLVQPKVSSGFTKQMVLEHTLTMVLLKTKQQHSPKLVVDLYSQSVEYQKPRHLPNWLLEPPYSMERQKKVSL